MDSKEFTLDISEINDDESNQHTSYGKPGKWLGFNFKKFFRHSSRCGDKKYSLEPGSCYTNCVDTYVILGFAFQNGNYSPSPCK